MAEDFAHVIDELEWRGLIGQTTGLEALRETLDSGPVTFYCGFDPTAASLHHGHLVAVKVMRHLQMAGHHPIVLVGGATGLVGDPRAKGERVLNERDVVAGWASSLKAQLESLLDFEGPAAAVTVNNLDWTQQMTAVDFLRDLGKYFRVGTMLNKDIVARRLASEEGISYTEFSYQILQANDYLELFRRYGCTLEVGGNDQWGNMTGGMDLIRKVEGESVHVLTNPLITKSDGTKFGKSEGGAIWLNPELLSPYGFYQFWLNTADADVIRMLKVFTFLSKAEIEALEAELEANPGARGAQRRLAQEVTAWVHGEEAMKRVEQASAVLFGKEDPHVLDAQTLKDATKELMNETSIEVGTTLVDAAVALGLEASKAAARRTIASGGLYLNNEKVASDEQTITAADVLAGGLVLVRRGRKKQAVASVSGATEE